MDPPLDKLKDTIVMFIYDLPPFSGILSEEETTS
jgi:hypothetical protein